jgi:hypothetical protein
MIASERATTLIPKLRPVAWKTTWEGLRRTDMKVISSTMEVGRRSSSGKNSSLKRDRLMNQKKRPT